jgi:putative ABC transport system permease protein
MERFRALFRKGLMDDEMDEELRFHIEMETEKNVRRGIDAAEARRQALIAFGGTERFKERAREERGVRPVEDLLQDVRYAIRQLRKNPGFSFVAILTLALGIGATTTIFSVVNGILLNPLTFREPDRLVLVWPHQAFSKSMLVDFRDQVPFLAGLSAFNQVTFTFPGEGDADAEELQGASVSFDHFQLLGVSPALGRGFTPEDELPGQGQVVILSHGLWERRFGADPDILGRAISVGEGEGVRRTVVGVMRPDFRPVYESWQLWVPFQIDPSNFPDFAGTASFRLLGRVAEGVSTEAASARFNEVAARLTADLDFITPEERAQAGVTSLREALLGDVQYRLLILFGSVGLVLLLACINVANLLLVRGQGRERELGIRLAVGAGRGRMVRQLLTESLVLGILGGGLGLLLAYWSLPALLGILPSGVPRADLVALDGRVLLFSLGVSVLSALLFGLLPALRATRRDVQVSLKDGGLGRRQGPSGQRLRNGLVVMEVALAAVVVVGASLLFRSFWLLQNVDPGFEAAQLLTLRLSPPVDRYPDGASRHGFYEEVTRQVSGIQGVTDVGWTNFLPLTGSGMSVRYRSDDSPVSNDYLPVYAMVRAVSPGFFSALGIPMPGGAYPQGLTGGEEEEVVLVNHSMALSLWPDGETPVGKTVWLPFGSETPAHIAGAVDDFAQTSLDGGIQPDIYLPWELWSPERMYLLVRTDGDLEALIPGVRAAVWSVDQDVPITLVRTMEEVVARTLADSRLTTLLLLVFGLLALTLGAVGIYGVASYAVSQSSFEIGIRMAMGAGREGVLAEVLGRFLAVAGVGIVLGMGAALGASRVLSSLLYQVSATDPTTFLGVGLFLALVALMAVFVPAFRASRVEPARVLKQE